MFLFYCLTGEKRLQTGVGGKESLVTSEAWRSRGEKMTQQSPAGNSIKTLPKKKKKERKALTLKN